MGSEDRLEYSVIGDTVNVAAKLTGAAEGGKVWVSARTLELISEHVTADPLEPLVVKGKRDPIEAYEIVDLRERWRGTR
jgi:class 3 adenylate cyclase